MMRYNIDCQSIRIGKFIKIGFFVPLANSSPLWSRWVFIGIGVLLSFTVLLTIPGILLIIMGLTRHVSVCPVCGQDITYSAGMKVVTCCYCYQRLLVKEGVLTSLDGKTHHAAAKPETKERPNNRSREVMIWIGIFLFLVLFMKDLIVPFLINVVILFIASGIAYPIASVVNSASKNKYKDSLDIFKKTFVWSALLLVLSLIIYGFTSLSTTDKTVTRPSAVPAQTQITKSIEKPKVIPTKAVSTSAAQGKPQCDPAQLLGSEFDACLQKNYPLPATMKADNTYLYITNPTNIKWTGCSMEQANGDYQMNGYDSFDVTAGSTESVEWGRMTDQNGSRFIYLQTQPGVINITCFEGKEMHESSFRGF